MERTTQAMSPMEMREGDEFECPNCGCQIRLTHHGDETKMRDMRPFTCCCGVQMESGGAAGA